MFDFSKEVEIEKERIKRLANWYKGKKEYPVQLDVELHKRCNLKCVFCPRFPSHEELNKISPRNEMPLETWLRVVEEAKEMKILIFNIEGANEPTVLPNLLFPLMGKVKENGMYGILTTNGTLWDEKKVKKVVEIEWDRLHISIDSTKEKLHDSLRGVRGSWRKTIKMVKLTKKWKKKMRVERPMLNLNICINKLNFRELPKMVKLAKKLGFDYIFTEPLMVFSEEGKKLKLNKKELKELPFYLREAKKLADEYEIDNNFATQDKNLEEEIVEKTGKMESILIEDVKEFEKGTLLSSPCFKPWDRIAIRYQGLTGHCGFIENGENVREKSLKEIWFGEYFEEVRKRMMSKQLFPHCHKCVPSDLTQRRRFRKELMEAIKVS